jgi:hypothetical protein
MDVIRIALVGPRSNREEIFLFNTGMVLSAMMSIIGISANILGYKNTHIVIGFGVGVYIGTIALLWARKRPLTREPKNYRNMNQ